jgi:MFS family permease
MANGVLNVAASAVVMTRTADELRGRVGAALGAIVSAGSVTSLVAGGALAAVLSPRQVFALSGALALAAVVVLVPRAIRASRSSSGARAPGGIRYRARPAPSQEGRR